MAADDYSKSRDTELILPPGVFAYVLDETKGKINTLCGPIKTSLSNTDRLVTYNADSKRFENANQPKALQTNMIVKKGQYVVLENPSKEGKQPEAGKLEDMPMGTLKMGQTENLPGPVSYALWPGQNATIIDGHHLRSNQYLLVRVYDDEAAKANWDKSVVKEATGSDSQTHTGLNIEKDSLVTGQLLVIKGTAIAFYIPPTGIEVLKDEQGKYVRDAVTLERLEYSILLDEDGNKEYVKGPAVVFPEPTQNFVTSGSDKKRKFRAFELQPTNGIHLKVIADYEENGKKYSTGDELFLTGAEQAIYYPRPEHATISYGGGDKHFATAIPAGEGRYVLDRNQGNIDLVKGPNMFLANPIMQVMVRRILTEAECSLYFPGNHEVLEVNRAFIEETRQPKTKSGIPILPTEQNLAGGGAPDLTVSYRQAMTLESAGSPMAADTMVRSQKYTPARTITLQAKYQGAVRIEVWSGYAVQVVNSKGSRRTVVGPETVLLEYDEKLERLSLSKGRPKNSDTRIDTAYLKHISNPVSDRINLKTQDLVDVSVDVKYLVRFEDVEKDKWFSVDNYTQYLVDHLRSLIGNAVRKISVQDFYQNAADILRDIVLGVKTEGKDRPLKHFDENGMTVYDLELLAVDVEDEDISELLHESRQEALTDSIELDRQKQKLALTAGQEEAKREIAKELDLTAKLNDELQLLKMRRRSTQAMAEIEANTQAEAARKAALEAATQKDVEILALKRDAAEADKSLEAKFAEAELERKLRTLMVEASTSETRMKSIQPGLVEALVASANAGILEKVTPQLAALAFVNGNDLETTVGTLLKGTAAEGILDNLKGLGKKVPAKV